MGATSDLAEEIEGKRNNICAAAPALDTIIDVLRRRAVESVSDAFSFLTNGVERERISYRDLDRSARSIAAKLQALGQYQKPVLILHEAGIDYIRALFGCFYAGAIAVPAPAPVRPRSLARLDAIARNCGSQIICSSGEIQRAVTRSGKAGAAVELRWLLTEDFADDLDKRWVPPDVEPHDLAFLQYTSGSTGQPKGVMVSHGDVMRNAERLRVMMQHTNQDVSVTWLPLFHDMGLVATIIQPIYAGFRSYLMSPAEFAQKPLLWLRMMSRFRATTTVAPNSGYEWAAQRAARNHWSDLDLTAWRIAANAAEPVDPGTLVRFSEAFGRYGFDASAFRACYGLAEATLLVTGTTKHPSRVIYPDVCSAQAIAGETARGVISCGTTLADCHVAIVNPATRRLCAPGEVGEIWVPSKLAARGYWNEPELTQDTFHATLVGGRDNYLRTGDLGFVKDDELFVRGRIKDLIIVRGTNYYPHDIETTVANRMGFLPQQCCAFSLEIAGEERPVVVIESAQELDDDYVDQLANSARAVVGQEYELSLYAVGIVPTGRLPRTTSGKLQRQICRSQFLDEAGKETIRRVFFGNVVAGSSQIEIPDRERLLRESPEKRLDLIVSYLSAVAAAELGISHDIAAPTRSLAMLGADSLSLTVLRVRIAQELAIHIPLSFFAGDSTIEELAANILSLVLPSPTARFELRIASNFTAEPIAESLQFWFAKLGISGAASFAPYDQVIQQLVDPTSSLNAAIDAHRIILLRPRDWLQRLRADCVGPGKVETAFGELVEQFGVALRQAAQRGGPIIVGICPEESRTAATDVERIRSACTGIPAVRFLDFSRLGELYHVDPVFAALKDNEGHIPFSPSFFAALGTAVVRALMAQWRTPVKVIVVDCDNTLWGGECGEVGPCGVTVGSAFAAVQRRLKSLRDSGFLLCLCSKNDEQSVFEVFQQQASALVLNWNDIAAYRINWLPKSENIAALAKELNLGLDSFLFLDDTAAERAEVRARCPSVLVPELSADPAEWPAYLEHYWALDQARQSTVEDRTRLYREETQRAKLRQRVLSLDDFIDQLAVHIDFSPIKDDELGRVSELALRTNQFNASNLRCNEGELAKWCRDPAYICERIKLSDKFGDYGIVGMLRVSAPTNGAACALEDFVLSCRALGKRVEHRMLERCADIAKERGLAQIEIRLKPTARNKPVQAFFASVCGNSPLELGKPGYKLAVEDLVSRLRAARLDQTVTTVPGDEASSSDSTKRESPTVLNRIATELSSGTAVLAEMRRKLQRRAPGSYVAPRTATERFVSSIWQHILRTSLIGRTDGFFDLGGDSLQLAEFVSAVYEKFGVAISLALLQDPTVASTADLIDSLRGQSGTRVSRPEPQWRRDLQLDPAIAAGSIAAPRYPAGHILLTGANGFLGSALLTALTQCSKSNVTCLIRNHNGVAAEDRLYRSKIWRQMPASGKARVRVVAGDLQQDNFGMAAETYRRLAAEIDMIIHCGAAVNFVYNYSILKGVNVNGTKEVLKFATTDHLKPLHFISTLGVLMSADRPHDVTVFEDEAPRYASGLPNGYEQSKWAADELVRMAAARGLPVAVYRPGMLISSSEPGLAMKPNEFIGCMIKGCIQLGFAPDLETEVELVPLDLAARLIVEIASRPDSIGHAFHIKHPQPIRMPELLEIVENAGYPIRPIPFELWKQKLFLQRDLKNNALFPFIDFIQQLEEEHVRMPLIDDSNTRRVLFKSDIPVEAMRTAVEKMLSHFEQSGFLGSGVLH